MPASPSPSDVGIQAAVVSYQRSSYSVVLHEISSPILLHRNRSFPLVCDIATSIEPDDEFPAAEFEATATTKPVNTTLKVVCCLLL